MAPAGLTRDAGWQLGVRRTVPSSTGDVWDFLTGEGVALWLGDTVLPSQVGETYRTSQGVTGELRSLAVGRRLRITWRPEHWDHDSTFQVTVIAVASGATIAFHQEHLRDADERAHMLAHWRAVLDTVIARLTPPVIEED